MVTFLGSSDFPSRIIVVIINIASATNDCYGGTQQGINSCTAAITTPYDDYEITDILPLKVSNEYNKTQS